MVPCDLSSEDQGEKRGSGPGAPLGRCQGPRVWPVVTVPVAWPVGLWNGISAQGAEPPCSDFFALGVCSSQSSVTLELTALGSFAGTSPT